MEGFERGRGPRQGQGAGHPRFANNEGPYRRGPRRERFGFDDGMHGPGGHFGRGRGRGGRGRRGDVRAAILLLLGEGPMHGYELIQQIVGRSEGVWKPSPGSIYPALAQLEDEGLVVIEKVKGRKTARLTEEGTTYVETNRDDLGSPWDDVRDTVGRSAQDLRSLIGLLMGAAGQVAAVGDDEQNRRAADVLAEARRSLYRILAEEPDSTGADTSDDEGQSGDAER